MTNKTLKSLDPRLRGNDGSKVSRRLNQMAEHLLCFCSSFPRTRESSGFERKTCNQRETSHTSTPSSYRHPREGGDPGLHRSMTLKSLDPRLRGDDDRKVSRRL